MPNLEINSKILKISGNAELPSELVLGDNYEVRIQGTIVKQEDIDNHDGFCDRKYTLKPILVETIDNKGESIKAKDTRSESQLFRGVLKKIWLEKGLDMDFESFYKLTYKAMYKYLNAIVEEIK